MLYPEIPQDRRYGYARVSSKSQEENSSLESQKRALMEQGIPENNICLEVASATNTIQDRPLFSSFIEKLKPDDIIFVTRIDRCARNTLEFLKLQERLALKNVFFVALDLPLSQDLAVNKFITTTFVAIATFENDRRKQRQKEGILAAKRAGNKYLGRKTVITEKLIAEVRDLKENKNLSITQIAKITGKGRTTIYKILKQNLNYIPYNRLVKNPSSKQE